MSAEPRHQGWLRTWGLILEDVAWYGPPNWASVVKAAVTQRTFRPVLTLRLSQAGKGPLRIPIRFAHRWACQRACVDLPSGLEAGSGLKITHGWGVVVNPGAHLGRDVILMNGATIGRRGAGVPTIHDGAFIGPQASVLGEVTIGRGATISAGCVITHDVPPDTMISLDHSSLTSRGYERALEKPNWS